ncbi:hypothetical protein CGC21_26425 [Leishmania donovani]|uniref:Uncharacterized protein n=1 Tax=Leishmania donovani TaxID=5661 RepID=A0A504WU41_LEIDO|nr:hypothetical protein CGC21_26425 [Leishmania donovani]
MAGHGDDGLRGAGASASPQPPLGNPRFGLSPQRASTSLNMPSPPLSSMYYSPQVPPAQCSGLSITPTVASFMSSSSSHSPTAARQIGFALTAAKRRWDLKERSGATCTAGVYYLIIGLVLLIDRLSSTVANYRVLMRSKSARPLRSSSAAVPAVGAPTALSGHGLLPRFSCSQMGSSFQCSQTNSMRESVADSEVDRRPCSATAASLSIRRRGG